MCARFWEVMGDIYGRSWYASNGETISETWVQGLRQFSVDDIRIGLEACRLAGDQYPVNMSQFFGRVRDHKRRAEHRPYKALLRPRSSREFAERGLAALRESIRKAPTPEPKAGASADWYRNPGCQCGCDSEHGIYPHKPASPHGN